MKLFKPYNIRLFPNEWTARNYYNLKVKLNHKAIIKKQDNKWLVKFKWEGVMKWVITFL